MTSATIIICTHNRERQIGASAAAALEEARRTPDCATEVLVVDNASTDDTRTVLAELRAGATNALRIVVEPRLGLSHARNRGLREAKGEVGVFLDDDAIPRSGWLEALIRPYGRSGVACVGGRVLLRFCETPPRWVTPSIHSALSAFDLGSHPRRLRYRPGDEYPYGANFSVRVGAALAVGGFSDWVGPRGRLQLVHDETDLCYRLDGEGAEIWYAPEAIVDHVIPSDRISPPWFLERHWGRGQSAAIFELKNRGLRKALGRIRWHYGRDLRLRGYRVKDPIDPFRFVDECRRREAFGYVAGLARWGVPLALSGQARLRNERGEQRREH